MKYLIFFAWIFLISSFGAFASAAAPDTDSSAGTLYLAAPGEFPNQDAPPLLIREFPRQALLIAARDGLGLNTKDQVLREWEPARDGHLPADASGEPALLMDVHWELHKRILKTQLFVLDAARTKLDGDQVTVKRGRQTWPLITDALASFEPLSRGKYVDVLQRRGYPSLVKPAGNADAPAGVDDLLYKTTLMAAFSAVQQTHAAIRESGESPARLGALVRGYANLGQLTRFQWSTIGKVMTARSLLYAQRMVATDPTLPDAYYHRAYAFTFAGLHAAALQDLTEAARLQKELQTAAKSVASVPDWVQLLEPACKYDVGGLADAIPRTDHRAALAMLLVFMDSENCGSIACLMNAGQTALQANGACFRIIDGMTARPGVISGHQLTELAPQTMLDTLPDEIKLLHPVPNSTQQALGAAHGNDDHIANLANVSKSFLAATEESEPSFALAGRIIQETNFIHVMRRAKFMADIWGVGCSDYVQQTMPLIEDHPLRAYVEAPAPPGANRPASLKDLQIIDPQFQMLDLLSQVAQFGKIKGRMSGMTAWARTYTNSYGTSYDTEGFLWPYSPQSDAASRQYASHILDVSPWSAPAIATTIRLDWKDAAPRLDEWEKHFHGQPDVLSALVRHYLDLKQTDKAEPLLRELVEVAPDRENLETLANIYLARNDEEKWLSTLQRVLQQPDYGLDHSVTESEIAWHFMNTGRYDRARPFADAGLKDSYSAASMQCDAMAAEYQGDYATAEQIKKAEVERYGGLAWFYWCKRSGVGDVAAAQKTADQWVAQQIQIGDHAAWAEIGNVLFLEDRLEQAKPYYEQSMHETNDGWTAMQLADVCAELHDTKGRDAALQYAAANCAKSKNGDDFTILSDYASLMLAAGDNAVDKKDVNALLSRPTADLNDTTNVLYFRSRELQRHGEKDSAKSDCQKLVHLQTIDLYSYMFACNLLHEMGEKTELPKIAIPQPVK